MKKVLIAIVVTVLVSCTKTTINTKVNPTDFVEITSVSKVYEPNGDVGRKLNLKFTINSDTSNIQCVKIYKQTFYLYDWWTAKDLYVINKIIDHNAGYEEVFYVFKWEYKDGTTLTQEPISTKL
jgi:hypothetical protein